jgi:hypothetical protein
MKAPKPDKIDRLMMAAQDLDLRARKQGFTVALRKIGKVRKVPAKRKAK